MHDTKSRQEGSLSLILVSGGGGCFLWILNSLVQILLVSLLKHVAGVCILSSSPAELSELHSSMLSSVCAVVMEQCYNPVRPDKIHYDSV